MKVMINYYHSFDGQYDTFTYSIQNISLILDKCKELGASDQMLSEWREFLEDLKRNEKTREDNEEDYLGFMLDKNSEESIELEVR